MWSPIIHQWSPIMLATKMAILLLSSTTRAAHLSSTPPLSSCNTSAFTVSLNHTQCFGLSEIRNVPTYQDCFSACCDRSQQMFQFCPQGETCSSYTGPSCWCGSADLSTCSHSPTIPWLGASQAKAPSPAPPTPPMSQVFLPPSRAAIPLLPVMDLGSLDATSPTPWTLSVDGGASRPILVPYGGYSSDAQTPPFIDQYSGVKATATYTRMFTPPRGISSTSIVVLSFGAVNHGARVFINGTLVGAHLGPMMPFDVDITAAVTAAAAAAGPFNLTIETYPYSTLVGVVPSGFMYVEAWRNGTNGWMSRSCAGLCRYVRLAVLPGVRVSNIVTAATISGATATLSVTVTVSNDSPSSTVGGLVLQGSVSSWNYPSPSTPPPWVYPSIPITQIPGGDLPPHSCTTLTFHLDWSALGAGSWWWPNRPYSPTYLAQLHFINLTLSTPAAADDAAGAPGATLSSMTPLASASHRFGFVQHGSGPYYYTLNGLRLNHLSDASPENALSYYDSYSFPGNFYATSPAQVWKKFMSLGITSNRVHQSTPTQGMLDAADEVGFLLKPESPVRGGCNYVDCPGGGGPNVEVFAQSMSELGGACRGHPSVFAYSVENETPGSLQHPYLQQQQHQQHPRQQSGGSVIGALIDAAAAADPSVPLTTEGSDGTTTPGYNGTTSGVYAVNLLHYALPDASRSHIRGVGECAWCVEDGLEEFSGQAVAGRVGDVAYYAGWDWFNYWSNFIPGYNASRHAWKQGGCGGRDRVDGVDGLGSPVMDWVVAGFAPFLPADLGAFATNPRFIAGQVWPHVVDSYTPGATVNRSVAVFNDVMRGDLDPLSPGVSHRVLVWSAVWDSSPSGVEGGKGEGVVAGGTIPVTVAPGFHQVVSVVFTAPNPGGEGGGARKLFIVYRNQPQGGGGEELVGVENRVYVLIE